MRFEDGAAIARDRSLDTCEVCRQARGAQTHHRQPRGMGGVHGDGRAVNDPSALVRVCQRCHDFIEHGDRDGAYPLGLLVRRPTPPGGVPVRLDIIVGPGWYLLTSDGNYGYWHGDTPAMSPAWAAHLGISPVQPPDLHVH